tara:strand:+ start:2170 stop:2550 length:381 start_codon:yes stop_codon:yes gene_type:complete
MYYCNLAAEICLCGGSAIVICHLENKEYITFKAYIPKDSDQYAGLIQLFDDKGAFKKHLAWIEETFFNSMNNNVIANRIQNYFDESSSIHFHIHKYPNITLKEFIFAEHIDISENANIADDLLKTL